MTYVPDELRDPQTILVAEVEPHRARFMVSFVVDADGHWRWRRRINPKGYGVFGFYVRAAAGETRGKPVRRYAHRVAIALFRGVCPADKVVDHACRVTDCCNPDHLELVAPSTNRARVGLPPESALSSFAGFGGPRRDDETPV